MNGFDDKLNILLKYGWLALILIFIAVTGISFFSLNSNNSQNITLGQSDLSKIISVQLRDAGLESNLLGNSSSSDSLYNKQLETSIIVANSVTKQIGSDLNKESNTIKSQITQHNKIVLIWGLIAVISIFLFALWCCHYLKNKIKLIVDQARDNQENMNSIQLDQMRYQRNQDELKEKKEIVVESEIEISAKTTDKNEKDDDILVVENIESESIDLNKFVEVQNQATPLVSVNYDDAISEILEKTDSSIKIDLLKNLIEEIKNDDSISIKLLNRLSYKISIYLSQFYFLANKLDDALTLCNNLIELYPLEILGYIERARIYKELGESQSAISDYEKVLEIDSTQENVLLNLGIALFSINDYQKAIEKFDSVLLTDSTNPTAYYYRGLANYKINETEKAISDYNEVIKIAPEFEKTYHQRGLSYYSVDEFEKAIPDFTKSLELNAGDFESMRLRANSYLKINETQKALEDFKNLILTGNTDSEIYFNISVIYFDQGKYRDAILNLDKSIDLDSSNSNAFFIRGMAYNYLQEYDDAIFNFNESLKISPSHAEVFYNRGNVYANQREYTLAISDYTQATSLNPSISEAYFNRANIYYNMNKFEEAIESYSQAVDANKNYIKAYFNRGLAYKAMTKYQLSITDFKSVIATPIGDVRLKEKSQKQIEFLAELLGKSNEDPINKLEL